MTLWGSALDHNLTGFTGDATVTGVASVPGTNPLRLRSNPLINIDAEARQAAPRVGGGQRVDAPIGPFVVTLSPITNTKGGPLALGYQPALAINEGNWNQMVAVVEFGRGGTKTTAWVDWPVCGGQFIVNCDSLAVSAMALNQATGQAGGDWPVRAGAWATPTRDGGGGQCVPPRYTMLIGDMIAGGTSGEIFIPPFARAWRFLSSGTVTDGTGALVVHRQQYLYRRFGATFVQDEYVSFNANSLYGVIDNTRAVGTPIPVEATTMVINNFSNPVTGARIEFTLDLT